MKTKQFKTALSRILCTVLIVAMALFTIGCGQQNSADDSSAKTTITQVYEDGTVIGEGETEFTFIVTDKDGNSKKFTVKTDSETVGEALQAVEIIHGDMGDYGLYVKEVNGIKIGIANFTYETPGSDPDRKYLNGGAIKKEANDYINTFSYQRIEKFYTEAQEIITDMKNKIMEKLRK